ncbi:pentraxin-related protein PTX3 [Osmerus mordax]|uniref:pentraxin-related protein PTX3 n=1 Tax=Osmerus mordax TaxID=8014 RepID=UPI00350FE8EA
MFLRTLLKALWLLLVCVSGTQGYEDEIEVNYADTFYNEISEGESLEPTPTPIPTVPCKFSDLTKWDKLFSMLENSQMRENMLLQYADDIIKVEMGALRGEMLSFVAQYGGGCRVAVETAGQRMSLQMESRLRDTLERLNLREVRKDDHQGLLQQLLSAARMQATRLSKLEISCLGHHTGAGMSPGLGTPLETKGFHPHAPAAAGGLQQQEVTSEEGVAPLERALAAMVMELKQTRAELTLVQRVIQRSYLPAGCETALLFPMRSSRIHTSVTPDLPLSLSSFTICLWAKPISLSNRTVLFSYGTRKNPYQIQLLLSRSSALFTVAGEAHLVEGQGVVKEGGAPGWTHLCGAWSSEQGLASLWADGRKVASTPGVAEGQVLSDGGSLLLGQEKSTQGQGWVENASDAKLAFAGKMTGVNVWDRVLAEEEISHQALQEGKGCQQRGNVVAWGTTEMVPHGGVQFIN